jgi:hypothetical protein
MQTLLTPKKLSSLLSLLDSVKHLDGAIAELGVYQGGALKALAGECPGKAVLGFDTFAGQPAQSWREGDFHRPGEFSDTSLEKVRFWMPANVKLKPGLFPDSTFGVDEDFCFAHVDFDLEKSTEDAIEWLRPRMVPGGLIVFDDYRWQNCPGVEKAIARAGLDVVESAPCQCYWRAP